jgi:hypothetical protein
MFDTSSPEFSYIVAFLQSDGHHSEGTRNKGRIQVELNIRDVDILEAMRTHIPYNTSLRFRTRDTNFSANYTSAILSIHAQEARATLKDYGVLVGRKSAIITPPAHPISRPDYVRGLIDADGAIGFTAKGYPFISIALCSDAMAQFYQGVIWNVCGVHRNTKRNSRDGVFNIMVASSAAVRLAQWLYPSDDCLSLKRKRVAAQVVRSWRIPADMTD